MPEWLIHELIALAIFALTAGFALWRIDANRQKMLVLLEARVKQLEEDKKEQDLRLSDGSAKFEKVGDDIHGINVKLGKVTMLLGMLCKKSGIDVDLD